jgi:ATP-dependent helicase/DNAse subunit B
LNTETRKEKCEATVIFVSIDKRERETSRTDFSIFTGQATIYFKLLQNVAVPKILIRYFSETLNHWKIS